MTGVNTLFNALNNKKQFQEYCREENIVSNKGLGITLGGTLLETDKIVYCGNTVILHEESASLKKNPVQKLFMHNNVTHFKKKWWDGQNPRYKLDHQAYISNSAHNEIKDK